MKREDLKALGLEDEIINKIMVEHGKSIQGVQAELQKSTDEKAEALKQIAERDAQLEKLKESSKDNESLSETIKELQAQNEKAKKEAETQLKSLQKSYAIEKALTESGALNAKAAKALLDLDVVKVEDDGSVIGLSEQLEKVKAENGFLFRKGEEAPKPSINPAKPSNDDAKAETELDPYVQEILEKYKK